MNETVRKIERLLEADDRDFRAQGVEMVLALADPDVDEWVLSKVGVRLDDDEPGHGEVWHDQFDAPHILRLLERASAGSGPARRIREQLTFLRLDGAEDLPALDHLAALPGLSGLRIWPTDGRGHAEHWANRLPLTGLDRLAALPDLELLVLAGTDLDDLRPLADLPALRRLALNACGLTDTSGLDRTALTSLRVDHAPGLATLRLPPTLRSLTVNELPDLTELPDLAGCTALEELTITDAPRLADLSPLAAALASGAPLRRVRLGLSALTTVDALAGATGLTHVDLGGCERLESIRALAGRPLAGVDLTGCAALADLDGFPARLEADHLSLAGCAALTDIGAVAPAGAALTTVDLRRTAALADLGPLAALPGLRVAAVWGGATRPDLVGDDVRRRCTWARQPLFDLFRARPETP
jgi:hypothetical protein